MATAAELEVVMRADVAQATSALKRVEHQLNETTKAGGKTQKGMKGLSGGFGGMMQSGAGAALKMAGAATAVVAVGAAMKAGIGNALSWETAMTGVAKTVDGTDAEIEALGSSITQMSSRIPVGRDELAKLAQVSGQLGVQQKNLKLYVETAAQLGVAVDDLSPEEAIVGLTKFGNVMGTNQEDVAKLGSTIVQLGNTMATTEGAILDMGQRMAAAGQIIGLSEGDVLGLAAALSSVGIRAESGGTAFSKVMVEISKAASSGGAELNEMARIAGMTGAQFQRLTKDTPIEAIKGFVVGLKNAQDSGENVFATLEGLGMTSVRLQQALLSASSASEMFTGAVESGNKAFKEGTALAEESEKAFGTTASQLQMVQNTFSNISAEIMSSFLPALSSLAGWANDMFVPTEKVVETFSMFPRPLKETAEAAEGTTDKFQDMLNQMEGSFSLLDTFTITSTDVQHAMELTGKSFHELKDFIKEAQVNAKKWNVDMDLAFKIMAGHQRPIKNHVDLLGDMVDELDELDRATRAVMPAVLGAVAQWRKSQADLATALNISADAEQRYMDLLDEFDVKVHTVNRTMTTHERRLWDIRAAIAANVAAINAAVGEFDDMNDRVRVNTRSTALATEGWDDAAEGLERIIDRTVENNIHVRDAVAANREAYEAQQAANAAVDEGTTRTRSYTTAVDAAKEAARAAAEFQRELAQATSDVSSALNSAGLDADLTAQAFAILEDLGVRPAVTGFQLLIDESVELARELGHTEDQINNMIRALEGLAAKAEEAAKIPAPGTTEGFAFSEQQVLERGRDTAERIGKARAMRHAKSMGLATWKDDPVLAEEVRKLKGQVQGMSRAELKRFYEGTLQNISFGTGTAASELKIGVPHFQHGGIVRAPTLAMIGEAGPEAVVPLTGGRAGGASVVVNVQGNLLTEHDLQQMILRTVQDGLRGGSFSHIERSLVPQLQ